MTKNLETQKQLFKLDSAKDFLPWLLVLLTVVVMVVQLRLQGRIWWCNLGDYSLLSSDAWGSHNSQHLFDPYSLTHILHGVLYFWLISLVFCKMPLVWQFFWQLLSKVLGKFWKIPTPSSNITARQRSRSTISAIRFLILSAMF